MKKWFLPLSHKKLVSSAVVEKADGEGLDEGSVVTIG